jgi:hypothetical protein
MAHHRLTDHLTNQLTNQGGSPVENRSRFGNIGLVISDWANCRCKRKYMAIEGTRAIAATTGGFCGNSADTPGSSILAKHSGEGQAQRDEMAIQVIFVHDERYNERREYCQTVAGNRRTGIFLLFKLHSPRPRIARSGYRCLNFLSHAGNVLRVYLLVSWLMLEF